MLIPRYSIRWLLGLTTFSAVVSLVLSQAVRGQAWAIGVVAGLWTFVILAIFYAVAFVVAWLIDQVATHRQSRDAGSSPFGAQPSGPAPFGPPAPQSALIGQATPDSPSPMTG